MHAFVVLVTIRWGDQIVRVERWSGGPAPEGLDLRLDARGRPCVAGAPLEIGAPIEVALGDGLAPYRTDHRTAIVAQVEVVPLRRRSGPSPKWRPIAAVAGALALHGVLVISAFARPALGPDEPWIDRDFEVDRPVRVLFAQPVAQQGILRDRDVDESACADPWSCVDSAAARPGPHAHLGPTHADRGCVPAKRLHVVEEGETLESIAALYGLRDYRAIYNEALNEDFVRRRPDPNRIFPGDELNIPGEGLCASY